MSNATRCQCGRPLPDSVEVFVRDEGAERIAKLEAELDVANKCAEVSLVAEEEAEARIAELEAENAKFKALIAAIIDQAGDGEHTAAKRIAELEAALRYIQARGYAGAAYIASEALRWLPLPDDQWNPKKGGGA